MFYSFDAGKGFTLYETWEDSRGLASRDYDIILWKLTYLLFPSLFWGVENLPDVIFWADDSYRLDTSGV